MSLLMDALRKAEEEKRKAEQAANAPAKTTTRSSPEPEKPAPGKSIPNVPLSLEAIAEEGKEPAATEPLLTKPTNYTRPEGIKTETAKPEVTQPASTVQSTKLDVSEKRPETSLGKTAPEKKPVAQFPVAKSPARPPPAAATTRPTQESKTRATPASAVKQASPAIIKKAELDSRASARSVFAAKSGGVARNRKLQLAALSGLAAVAVSVTGFYLLNSGSSGISVTIEGYDPSQQLPPMEITVVEESQFTEPVSETPTTLPPGDLDEAALTAAANAVFESIVQSSTTQPIPVIDFVPVPTQANPPAVLPSPALATAPAAEARQVPPSAPELPGTPASLDEIESEPSIAVATPEPEIQNNVSFVRRNSVPQVDPRVEQAFAAYQQGDLDDARLLYQATLVEFPLHRDALLGAAAIARARGELAQARDFYSRLLTRDPRDAVARAGLLELMSGSNVSGQETELRRLIESHPELPSLYFALGNIYASQQRWSEAQQVYFDALHLAKSTANATSAINPDYAFNLAVSLEHLNQPQPAIRYYREALEHASRHPAGFDIDLLRRKLLN
jgi:tetratricopeptide (TPR) repeat protein